MRTTSYLALSRQVALERHMATIANNLANATTSGYRAEHTVFEEMLQRAGRHERVAFVQDVGPGPRPRARGRSSRPATRSTWRSTAPATWPSPRLRARATGAPAGSRSTMAGGWSTRRRPPCSTTAAIPSRCPRTSARSPSPPTAPSPAAPVSWAGSGSWASPTSRPCKARATACSPTAETPPSRPAAPRMVQGALEGSNVQPVLEMTTMLETARAFEGAQRLLDTEHELERQAIERIGPDSGLTMLKGAVAKRADERGSLPCVRLSVAATGMMAQQLHVEVISNNIANMTTTGYKRRRAGVPGPALPEPAPDRLELVVRGHGRSGRRAARARASRPPPSTASTSRAS